MEMSGQHISWYRLARASLVGVDRVDAIRLVEFSENSMAWPSAPCLPRRSGSRSGLEPIAVPGMRVTWRQASDLMPTKAVPALQAVGFLLNIFAVVAAIILAPIPAAVGTRPRILMAPPPVILVEVIIIRVVVDIREAPPSGFPFATAGRHM